MYTSLLRVFFFFALAFSAFGAVLPREAEPESEGLLEKRLSVKGTHTGQGTYYDVGLGACGKTNHDSELVAAVSHTVFDQYPGYKGGNPNNNPVCGKKIKVTYKGKSVTIKVVDRCPGCSEWDLDLSPTAFSKLASKSVGRLHGMKWEFH